MSVRKQIEESNGIYFITFTCARWLHLFDVCQSYGVVYNWFDYLKSKGHYIVGYVIMPNHVHALIGFANKGVSINKTVGNGKRFMAYEIIRMLQLQKNEEILYHLSSFVNSTDKKRGKMHEVFEPSFDWKECYSPEMIEQKLKYIHANPCRGSWSLVESPIDYAHSSAMFYSTGQGAYEVTSYSDLKDIDLTKLTKAATKAAESRGGDSAEK
jgi:REP element-mobilizing transposase RayT